MKEERIARLKYASDVLALQLVVMKSERSATRNSENAEVGLLPRVEYLDSKFDWISELSVIGLSRTLDRARE